MNERGTRGRLSPPGRIRGGRYTSAARATESSREREQDEAKRDKDGTTVLRRKAQGESSSPSRIEMRRRNAASGAPSCIDNLASTPELYTTLSMIDNSDDNSVATHAARIGTLSRCRIHKVRYRPHTRGTCE